MNCGHPERPNVLSLPSAGNPHCCAECWKERTAGMTAYKGKREAWDHSGYDHKLVAGQMHYLTSYGWMAETVYDERMWK